MIIKLSDYIVSPLALGTHANYERVKAGDTRLRAYVGKWGLSEPFVASMMDDAVLAEACVETGIDGEYTKFERMAILAAARALQETGIRFDDSRVLFILSTTKGNVGLLDGSEGKEYPMSRVLLPETAGRIAGWFRNPNEPLVVCNACISGLSAQAAATRALESGKYRYAVVIGADVLSPFIVSGFQSLKALSDDLCRPFDEDRTGLNLGEAAACIVYGCADNEDSEDRWHIVSCANRNDAFHTSSPSKTAEGAFRSLKSTLDGQDVSDLAFVNVHGTATLFNDEMEAIALSRAGLDSLPTNGLKGYFGHTMGAAGILETLISMEALDDRTVLGTKGFEHLGVSRKISLSAVHRQASGKAFLKMMVGFGGCNAVMMFRKGKAVSEKECPSSSYGIRVTHTVHLTEREVVVDGEAIKTEGTGMDMLKGLYHTYVGDYPKFYKMDPLCKLGFMASELLLEAEAKDGSAERFSVREERAVVFVGRSASICADKTYLQTIAPDAYYPSPSAFIYTLPNILTGEIAIRNHYHGETVYLAQDYSGQTCQLMAQAFSDPAIESVIGGWVEMENTEKFEATLYIIKKIMEELVLTLKQQIIEALNLEDVKSEDIDNDAPLFGEGLGLDSIDALELIVLLEKNYGIKLSDPAQGKAIFKSINTMAEYIAAHRTK